MLNLYKFLSTKLILAAAMMLCVGMAAQAQSGDAATVQGKVVDAQGEALPGVSVGVKGTTAGAITGADGRFSLRVADKNATITLTYLGMKPLAVPAASRPSTGEWVLTMQSDEHSVDEVVVTGFFERDKVSYTGSAMSYSRAELKNAGNQNLIQSLKSLDPSFVVVDNITLGSNPNATATIELRGQSSGTLNAVKDEFSADPNQPLFVVNGVETTLARVQDLDINRIESITILKDAGSTAIYGSKGSNGVIVIETIRPKAGEFTVYYNGDFQLSTPDLTVYNMMNSAEKLEFERLAERFTSTNAGQQKALRALYNHYAAEVARGVDTYWLSEPVRTSFTHGHSVRVSGGSEELAVEVGGKYKSDDGVMKGSGRDSWGGNVDLMYRNKKLQVSNQLAVSGYTGDESPYGSFSTWVNASPYFRKRNADGSVDSYLQRVNGLGSSGSYTAITKDIPNPLYNALLGGIDQTSELYVTNNFFVQYSPISELRFRTGIDINATRDKLTQFTPPEHTQFANMDYTEKGSYYNRDLRQSYYRGYVDGSLGKVFADMHSVNMFVRGFVEQTENEYVGVRAVGFPYGAAPAPNLAHSYQPDAAPPFSYRLQRQIGLTSAFNYSYDKRYLLDFSYSLDGATTFGSNRLYHPFWSVGVGWNIDREKFMRNFDWLDMLKLRASTGLTGNQNQGRAASESVYQYFLNSNLFGQGAYLSELANPNLPWQVARDYSAGIDFKALGGRYSLSLDVYQKRTDPNLIFVPQKPSVGIATYPMELGSLTGRGVELVLAVSPIYRIKERIIWTVRLTGAHTRSVYGGIGRALDDFNESQRNSSTMQQYVDGYSPTDIWAVRSYGIDPSTGEEVFITKDGQLTMEYNASDMVMVGSSRPDMEGVIGTTFRYKNFDIGVNLRYSYGSDIYNTDLYNKVENISKSALEQNQDRRALYDRWQQPGDVAAFKAIRIVSSTSPRTSRFVQRNNYLRCESIRASYELANNPWLRRYTGVQYVKVNAYLNDIFRLETSKVERGISYPFARSVSLGLSLTF